MEDTQTKVIINKICDNLNIDKINIKVFKDELNKKLLTDSQIRIQKFLNKEYDSLDRTLFNFDLSDIGNGERFEYKYGNIIKYCYEKANWMIWDDKKWIADFRKVNEQCAKSIAIEMKRIYDTLSENYNKNMKALGLKSLKEVNVETLTDPILKQLKEDEELLYKIGGFIGKCQTRNSIRNMLEMAQSEFGMTITENKFDADKYLFNCDNGIVDFNTLHISKHDETKLMTKISPVSVESVDINNLSEDYYIQHCPNWIDFINKIFLNDKEMVDYIWKCLGYSLTGDTFENCFFMLWGDGSNGKSTFCNLLQYIAGDYGQTLDSKSLMKSSKAGNEAREDLYGLRGSRVVITSELNEDQEFDYQLLKKLTGGSDAITARPLYGKIIEYIPQCKIWICTNKKPLIKEDTLGIWRRVRLIPFEYTFTDEEKDIHFFDKLKGEAPAILNWMIDGYRKYKQEGMETPEKVKAAIEEYKNESDIIESFISECINITSNHSKVSSKDVYETYKNYCIQNCEEYIKPIPFGLKMKKKGFKTIKSGIKYYINIELVDSWDSLASTVQVS